MQSSHTAFKRSNSKILSSEQYKFCAAIVGGGDNLDDQPFFKQGLKVLLIAVHIKLWGRFETFVSSVFINELESLTDVSIYVWFESNVGPTQL